MADSQSTNGKVPETQQPDLTQTLTLDQRIGVNEPRELPKIDINQAVLPGNDAVVNHVDGSQEVASGPQAAAVHAAEAVDSTQLADPAQVSPTLTESPRSSDPETNGPDQQVAGQTADEVVAASQPDVLPGDVTSAAPTESVAEDASESAEEAPAEAEAPAADAAEQPSAADVEGV